MPRVQTARLAEIQSLQPHGQFIVTSALRLMGSLSCDVLLVYQCLTTLNLWHHLQFSKNRLKIGNLLAALADSVPLISGLGFV